MKKKVLVLVDWYTPGFRAGGPIRSCANLVDWLSEEIDFSVITTDRDWGSDRPYENIPADQWTEGTSGERIFYFSPGNLNYRNLEQLILTGNYDFILLNSMYSRAFTVWPLKILNKHPGKTKILLAPRGMLRPGALAIKSFKKKIFLRYFKFCGWQNKVIFVSTGEHETEDIHNVFGKNTTIRLAPNLPSRGIVQWSPKNKAAESAELISIGRISEVKNTLYAIRVLKQVKGKVRLRIFGPENDPVYAAKCKEEAKNLPSNVEVVFGGEIHPLQVTAALSESHFFLMPSVSENFGHAIYEAMSHGLPVIIGDQTPWRGLEQKKAGWDISLLDENKFQLALQHAVSMNQEEYSQWSSSAWKFANEFANDAGLIKANRELFR